MRRLALLAIVPALFGCGSEQPPVTGGGVAAGWPAYGGGPGGTHYSRANQITPENVRWLERAWVHHHGDIREAVAPGEGRRPITQSSFQATPILAGDTLYYCSPFNRVFALDAATGAERWVFDPEVDHTADFLPNCRGVSSWRSGEPGFCEHRILTGTLDARLIALDAATGRPCPGFGDHGEVDLTHGLAAHAPHEYSVTSPPAILGDLAIVGAMVLDNQRTGVPSGVVRAYDVRTGELRWAWNPVPPDIHGRNPDGTYLSGSTNVWSIISVDAERNLVFAPTGNTSPDFFGGHRNGLDAYSSSVVALDGDTGELVWHFQTVHHDVWDYDVPAQPTLMDLDVNGERVPVVVQVTKMGLTFILDRDTGEPVFPVEERGVPQGPVAGEYLSPTQPFPTHVPALIDTPLSPADAWGFTPWDRGECEDAIAGVRNDGIYTPPSLTGSLYYPGAGGGNNWGSPAIHVGEQVMVVATTRVPSVVKLTPRADCGERGAPQLGTPYCVETHMLASPLGVPCTAPPWGTLDAIDLASGEIRWSVPLGTTRDISPFPFWWIDGIPGSGGPMVTATGLVFVGTAMEHVLRAFDLDDGEELWRAALPTSANSVPMTYQLGPEGRQYVVVAAGGHWGGRTPAGDSLIAFALPVADGGRQSF